ncbi:MAG: FAD:protein FMN transferase [Chloroflexota bacterium]
MNVARFRAMNTDISLLAAGADSALFARAEELTRQIFERVEQCLSRFRPDSELCALNRAAGTPFVASSLLLHAVSLALDAARATKGIFDPSVLPALEAAGYDRSFEQVVSRSGSVLVPPALTDYRTIRVDRSRSTITLDTEQRIDLGGIGKGFAIDLALDATSFLSNRCLNAGGDIAVRGTPTGEGGWTIDLEDTGDTGGPMSIRISDSALATSTVSRRCWTRGSNQYHHVIDPRTRMPSTSPVRSMTVVAGSCVEADVAAKTALIMGGDGLDFIHRRGMHALAVQRDGTVLRTPHWPET